MNELTPPQAASMLQASATTLRRWSTQFAAHLSPAAGVNVKRRRYTADDIATLQRVKDMLHDGLSPAEIDQRLTLPAEAPASTSLMILPEMMTALQAAAARDAEQSRRIDEQQRAIDELKADKAERDRRIDELAARLDKLEGRSFWARLFNRGR